MSVMSLLWERAAPVRRNLGFLACMLIVIFGCVHCTGASDFRKQNVRHVTPSEAAKRTPDHEQRQPKSSWAVVPTTCSLICMAGRGTYKA
jgi:hypothetical protein